MPPEKHRSRSRSPRDGDRHRGKRRGGHDDSRGHRHRERAEDRHSRGHTSSSRHGDRSHQQHRRDDSSHSRNRDQPSRDREQPSRDREQPSRDREQPTRDREQQQQPRVRDEDRRRAPLPQEQQRQQQERQQQSSESFGAADDRHSAAPGGDKQGRKDGKKEEGTAHIDSRNFERSGKLVEDTNTYRGVVIKYSEPPEARKPQRRWRLYPFKGKEELDVLYIHRQSAYLIGRERKVCDIPMHHPSISKQHAALQYRLMPYKRENGSTGNRVSPYLIDLDSTNGCYINNQRIDPQRYYELKQQDMVKFGFSSREYVVLHEGSKDDDLGLPTDTPVVKDEPGKE